VNAYGAIVLAALLFEFAVGVVADALNLRALDPEVPAEFRDVYDADRYRRVQAYTRARARFGLVASGVQLALLLAFWFAGGFARLDRSLRTLGLGPIATGLLYLGVLGVGRLIVGVPFRWWSTFVVEERFGFNRTAPKIFWMDLLKGAVLAVLLGGPLLAAILWLFERTGTQAWLWCWLASAVYVLGVEFIAPTWIMPLFNSFEPLGDGALRDAVLAYARAVAFPLEGVFVMDGSRRTSKANALFTGFGRHKRIALFDTLLDRLAQEEVVAVLAHEIGHYKRHHVVQGTIIALLHLGVALFVVSALLARPGLFAAFGMQGRPVYAGLVFAALLLSPAEMVLAVLLHALSRRNEFQADAFAVATTGSGERLAHALKRLSADALSNLTPHPLYVVLHYSHPPMRERVRALRSARA